MFLNKRIALAAALLVAGGFVSAAQASGTSSTSFQVALTVNSTCTVSSSTGITFASLTASTTAPTESANAKALNVLCSSGTPYIINLTPSNSSTGVAGGNSSTTGAGYMAGTATGNTATTIAYQLTSDSTGNTPWGNGSSIGGTTGNGFSGVGAGLSGGAVATTVYAKLTGTNLDVPADTYKDTVAVSLVY